MGALGGDAADREAKLHQIEKLTSSGVLQGSESLCNLLRFLARQSLDQPGSAVKEHQIATEVFARAPDFDPRVDSALRVQTGRLRSKIAEYYTNDGASDPIVVEIPRGSYQVIFHEHEQESKTTKAKEISPAMSVEGKASPRKLHWLTTAVAAAVLMVSALALDFALRPRWRHIATTEPAGVVQTFWKRFFDGSEPPLVVYSNAAFVGRPETGLRNFNPVVDTSNAILDHYTGVGEVMAIHELDSLFTALHRTMRLKRGRLLTGDDAKASNLIFIGSPSENLSVHQMPGTEDFVFKVSDAGPRKGDLSIINNHPRSGEDPAYFSSAAIPIHDDYAVIGLIPRLSASRNVMILAGLTTLGTQAAVEFVCRPKKLEELFAALGAPPRGPVPAFEALLRVKVSGGVPVQSELLAVRRKNN
jgi:hypothetical protein